MKGKFLKDFKGQTIEGKEGEIKDLTETQFAALSYHGIVEIYNPVEKKQVDKTPKKTK